MPVLERDDGEIYYEESGEGYPVLALAPGWLGSRIEMWPPRPDHIYPWANWPEYLKSDYRVVAMDQRNAGRSRTAIAADHGWHTYLADHVALVDHLGLERFHVVGICIGASYALQLCEAMSERISALVMPQPIGLHPDHPRNFPERFDKWAAEKLAERPDLDADAVKAFGHNMWDGDFVYSVTRDYARSCETPSLVMPGDNIPHPEVIGRELAELLPNSELVTEWQCPDFEEQQLQSGGDFLKKHTPG